MRAIGYIRVSTEEQGRAGHSLDMQPQRIRQWCELQQLELVDVIRDEGVSAGTALDKRKGGAQLLKRLEAGEAEAVVVFKLDRLFRDTLDGLLFFRNFAEARGLVVHSVSELIDTSTPHGRLNLNIQLSLAEYERGITCERNRAVSDHLRSNGRAFGHTPYGCIAIDRHLFRDPATWPHRELIVALREQQKLSHAQIIAELHTRGIASPLGSVAWGKNSVARVVRTHGELNGIPPLPAGHES